MCNKKLKRLKISFAISVINAIFCFLTLLKVTIQENLKRLNTPLKYKIDGYAYLCFGKFKQFIHNSTLKNNLVYVRWLNSVQNGQNKQGARYGRKETCHDVPEVFRALIVNHHRGTDVCYGRDKCDSHRSAEHHLQYCLINNYFYIH